ncbi:hypothetical protein Tco_0290412 [Tanacetum coccineum]
MLIFKKKALNIRRSLPLTPEQNALRKTESTLLLSCFEQSQKNVVPTAEKTDLSHQGLEFLFSPLIEEYYTPAHGHAEDNNNDQAPNASFQEDELASFFVLEYKKLDHPLEQVHGNPTMPVQTRRQLATDLEMSGRNFIIRQTKSLELSQTIWQDDYKAKVVMEEQKDKIRLLIAHRYQMDVKMAFLNGPLKERVTLLSQKVAMIQNHPEKGYLLRTSFGRIKASSKSLRKFGCKETQPLQCLSAEAEVLAYLQLCSSNVRGHISLAYIMAVRLDQPLIPKVGVWGGGEARSSP